MDLTRAVGRTLFASLIARNRTFEFRDSNRKVFAAKTAGKRKGPIFTIR